MDTNRFNNPKYKQQINAVRGYRRLTRGLPENKFHKFLHTIKIGTIPRQVLVVLFLAVIVYLIYFAPFLNLIDIRVSGANDSVVVSVKNQFQEYLSGRRWLIFPLRNTVFFNSQGFKNYIHKNNPEVSEVRTVKRDFSGVLLIDILQRVPAYILETQGRYYILNSDGNLGREYSPQNQNTYLHIHDLSNSEVNPGDKFYDLRKIEFLNHIKDNFNLKTAIGVEYFEIPDRESTSLTIQTNKSFRIYLDTNKSSEEYIERIFNLWTSLNNDQQKRMYYIDMRFSQNAYVCLQGDPCSKLEVEPDQAIKTESL
jgi:cell division septal protein FtsQ